MFYSRCGRVALIAAVLILVGCTSKAPDLRYTQTRPAAGLKLPDGMPRPVAGQEAVIPDRELAGKVPASSRPPNVRE